VIAAVLLVALVALAVVVAIAWPLVGARGDVSADQEPDADRQELQDEIDRSLRAIREIDQDHRAGDLSDDDFAALDAEERARAAELLRRRDDPVG
jgi:flagellar motility protein MotE (MotC chaperone)